VGIKGIFKSQFFCLLFLLVLVFPVFTIAAQNQQLTINPETDSLLFNEDQLR